MLGFGTSGQFEIATMIVAASRSQRTPLDNGAGHGHGRWCGGLARPAQIARDSKHSDERDSRDRDGQRVTHAYSVEQRGLERPDVIGHARRHHRDQPA